MHGELALDGYVSARFRFFAHAHPLDARFEPAV
jgi:hypothetical protein